MDYREIKNFAEAARVIDAKFVYDAVVRNGFLLKQYRRTAIYIEIVRTSQHVDTIVRWYKHTKVLADAFDNAEVSERNDAMMPLHRHNIYRYTSLIIDNIQYTHHS